MELLPIDVLRKIGDALVLCERNESGRGPFPWHDGATAAAAAASCVIAGGTSLEIGFAAYRALLASHQSGGAPDASVIPEGVTAGSPVKQLRAALAEWRLARSGNKAELWARLKDAHSPLCPVPRSLRHRGSALRSRAPDEEYGCVSRHATRIADVHAASLKRFGSLRGFEDARAEKAKEAAFFVVHCQPYYDQEVSRYVREWDAEQEEYYDREGGGSYWRQRERYRDGYDDEEEELAAVANEAATAVKPQALERWVAAYEGGPRRAAADARLPRSFRQQLCTRLAEEELDRWAAARGVPAMLDDLPHAWGMAIPKRHGEVTAFARGRMFAGEGTIRTIRDVAGLDAACEGARLDAIYDEVAAWCARARDAHLRVSTALDAARSLSLSPADAHIVHEHDPRHDPVTVSLYELYPSIECLLAVDARLDGDAGAVRDDFDRMIGQKMFRGNCLRQLLGDISDLSTRGNSGMQRTCALCGRSSRKFGGEGLRSHAASKHGVVSDRNG